MARTKKDAPAGEVFGRALIDIPGIAACGEYLTLPSEVAEQLELSGAFDPNAVELNG